VTVEMVNLRLVEVPAEARSDLCTAYAKDIASTCGVDESSVVDLEGKKAAVSISEDGSISAFVLGISGYSANQLAARLYSPSFRGLLVKSTLVSVGAHADAGTREISVGAVALQPEQFVPQVPTTTRTSTSTTATSTSRAASTGVSAGVSSPSPDEGSAGAEEQKQQAGPAWWWFFAGAAVVGGAAAAACALAVQKTRQKGVDAAGSQV